MMSSFALQKSKKKIGRFFLGRVKFLAIKLIPPVRAMIRGCCYTVLFCSFSGGISLETSQNMSLGGWEKSLFSEISVAF